MATRADSGIRWASVWQLIADPAPGRLAFAARLALICTLVAIFAETYTTPEIALTVYLVFFLNKPDRMSSMALTIAITVLITLLVGLLLLLAEPVWASSAVRVLTMASISFAMLFFASASKLKPLASTIALVLAYALDVLGSVPVGELGTRGLLYAWLFVGIPALISVVVNLLIAPSPRSIAQKEIAERLRFAAKLLIESDDVAISRPARYAPIEDAETQAHLKLAGLEKTSSDEDIAALKGASDCVVIVLSAVQLMLDEPQAMPPENLKRAIEFRLLEVASIFAAGGYAAKVDPVNIDDDCTGLAVSAVDFLNTGLTQFGELRPTKSLEKPKEHAGFFLPDAFTNPAHTKFAFKITAAAMLCYLLYSILSWPGIHTALITCFIVSLGTAAESVEKLTLRILGCLVGAGLGLLVMIKVIPLVTNIGSLAVIVFVGAFLGAWIAAGDKHISYAGFQIAFAYFLCVIQGPSPSFNMVVARDRVIGILLGNIVSYFMATRIWPVSVGPRIDNALHKARHNLENMMEAIDRWSRRRLAAETHSILDAIKSDIHLAAYEPASIRPGSTWLDAQQHAAEAARRLEPVLLGIAELAPEQERSRLRGLLNWCAETEPYTNPNNRTEVKSLVPLENLVRVRISAFEQALSNLKQAGQDE
ncbi:FUSC family protein [Acidicapsa ligni]|uniref:FUSC family protein n=1 Tax=Acidicapsa ligni TaxID=542300 RepID=UPI0021E0A1E8|nr:FUSC family protein [Acidicapsa ligni]